MNNESTAASVRQVPIFQLLNAGRWLGVGLLYFVLSKISYLTMLPEGLTPGPALAWLPTGFAAAVLIFEGYKLWPGILIGSLLNSTISNAGPGAILGFAVANTLDPLIVAVVPRLILKRDVDFTRPADVSVFVGVAIFLSSTFSATVGASSLYLSGAIPAAQFVLTWSIWWVSDFLSVLILTPMLLAPLISRNIGPKQSIPEAVLVSLAAICVTYFIFSRPFGHNTLHFVYWVLPFIVWLAFRSGHKAMNTGIFLLALTTIVATSVGLGPFITGSVAESFLNVQSFLAVVSITGLFMAALVSERNRAIDNRDRFLMIASQELHAPLNALRLISFFLNRLLAKDELDQITRSKRLELVAVNAQEITRLTQLVEELMEASKIAAGKLDLERRHVDLSQVVAETIKNVTEQNSLRPNLIEFESEGPVNGNWDREKIQSVVRALLSNAVRFGQDRSIRLEVRRRDNKALLTVEDRGIGIAPEDQGRIFSRFCRLNPVQERGGLGQSLFISKAIAQAHGGQISVESALRRGAKFTLELPV